MPTPPAPICVAAGKRERTLFPKKRAMLAREAEERIAVLHDGIFLSWLTACHRALQAARLHAPATNLEFAKAFCIRLLESVG